MSVEIKLNIPKTSSNNLPKVLEIAKTFNDFYEPTQKKCPYQLVVEQEELCTRHNDLEKVYIMARNWKGTQLFINGRIGNISTLNKLLEVFRCADQRSSAVIPDNFCQPKHALGWGCKRLTTIQLGLPQYLFELDNEYGFWFCFGYFAKNRAAWNVDKAKLLETLKREASSRHVDMCPFFNQSYINTIVDDLPTCIELSEDSPWEIHFKEEYNSKANMIQKVPIGIKPKNIEDGPIRSSIAQNGLIAIANNEEDIRYIPEVSFKDIGGINDIINTIREVIELPLRHPALFKHLGIAPHKGILLYGPPGCGKTLIAKAIANEIQAHFIPIRGPELFSKWFGESESNLREIFSNARKYAPSIIFFDEIDAIAQKRSGEESIRHESVFVNQLLALMDGMEAYENVCVIASTNRPELLDNAIMRPGRFDYTIEIKRPTLEGCRKIFRIHTRNMPLAPSVDIESITARMKGFTGAEIAFVAREGAYNCLRRHADITNLINKDESNIIFEDYIVEQYDFEKALVKILDNHEVTE